MRAIITVVGKDKVGIVAQVTEKLAQNNLNIVDLSQTLMDDFFTMIILVEKDEEVDFRKLQEELTVTGQNLGLTIRIQNEEIFSAMHKI
ncbi:MAG: ACT domain-containing protein [Lactobacillaceae bacterium]|jgi:ACT domain-containing protein|nr:ACT domain-containing protein [Lactobacillaceae bacterium]